MYVLMGSNGNITSSAARLLLAQGQPVRVIGRDAASLAALAQRGAAISQGDARDAGFLAQAFTGAAAVYVMIPTDYGADDLLHAQAQLGTSIASAIARSGVRRVVNLSSVGADQATGTGPIAGLHQQERRLDAIPGLELLHLRPGYFMENHLLAAPAIAALGVYPSPEASDVEVPMVATADIAAVVARELSRPTTRGVLHLHAPRHYRFREAARILGGAIGLPDLRHEPLGDDDAIAAMREAGLSPDAAARMLEMARWLSAGTATGLPGPVEVMPTTLEAFAPRLAQACAALAPAQG